jgi:hypothetical protein
MRNSKLYIFILASIILSLVGSIRHANAQNPLVTEVMITRGDSTFRNIYLYNSNNAKTLEVNYVKVDGNWTRRKQTEWYYENGVCIEQQYRDFKNGEWKTYYKIKYLYSEQNLSSETHLKVSSGVETFVSKTEFAYEANRIVSKQNYRWVNNIWEIFASTDYVYNENLLLAELILKEYKNQLLFEEQKTQFSYDIFQRLASTTTILKIENNFKNKSLTTYFYKPNSPIILSEISKKWDDVYQKWTNEQNTEYAYDGMNNLITEDYKYWQGTAWANKLMYSYQYNGSNALVKHTTYLPIYNDYRPAWSIIYSNFEYDKASLIEAKNEFWGGETGELYTTFIPYQFNESKVVKSADKIEIGYTPINESEMNDLSTLLASNFVQVYPNPSKGIFYFETEKFNVNYWIVSDLSGKTIYTNNQLNGRSGVVDITEMKSGVYLLHVYTNEGVKTQKLIKE